jgi:hypothetical protein
MAVNKFNQPNRQRNEILTDHSFGIIHKQRAVAQYPQHLFEAISPVLLAFQLILKQL